MEVIHIHFTSEQIRRLHRGHTVQLTAQQMTSKQGQSVELHMLHKHGNEMRRAIKKGKSYRFTPKKIEVSGGKLLLPEIRPAQKTVATASPAESTNQISIKPKPIKKTSESSAKKVRISPAEKILTEVVDGLPPIISGSTATKLKSVLKPDIGYINGQGQGEACKSCQQKPRADNGAENHTLLNRPTPRVHPKRVQL
jgi:hypothetical protein